MFGKKQETSQQSTEFLEEMDPREFEHIWRVAPSDVEDLDHSTYTDEEQGRTYRARFSEPRTKEASA